MADTKDTTRTSGYVAEGTIYHNDTTIVHGEPLPVDMDPKDVKRLVELGAAVKPKD